MAEQENRQDQKSENPQSTASQGSPAAPERRSAGLQQHVGRSMGFEAAEAALAPDAGLLAPIQAKGAGEGDVSVPTPRGGGAPLDAGLRVQMERSFGADFGGVRVHDGPSAESMGGVRAATQGSDITFAQGEYQPGSTAGKELIGHELTHVVHQAAGRVQPTAQAKGGMINTDPGLEAEADRMGALAAEGKAAPVAGAEALGGRRISGGPAQFNIFTSMRDKVKDKYKQHKQERADAKQQKQDQETANRTALDQARDDAAAGAPKVAADAVTELGTVLSTFVEGQLGKDSQLVAQLKAHGAQAAKDRIGAGGQAEADAGAQGETLEREAGAALGAMSEKAREIGTAKAGEATILDDLLAAAKTGFDETTGSGDVQALIVKARQKAQQKARKAATARAMVLQRTIAQELEANKATLTTELEAATTTNVEAKADAELQDRTTKEPEVAQAMIGATDKATTAVKDAALVWLEDKLGASGVAFTRSKKLQDFRKAMGERARQKAASDADTETTGKNDELREDARKRTKDGADSAATEALKALAVTGRDAAFTDAAAATTLTDAASKAAWGAIRSGGDGKKAAKQAAVSMVPRVQEAVIAEAKTWRDAIVKTQTQLNLAEQAIDTKVTDNEVGKHAADASKAKEGDVDLIVNALVPGMRDEVKGEVTTYLTHEIGALGASWLRSQEVRNFRKKMKDAGREQAYGDVDTAVAGGTERSATKAYMRVAGRDVAYDKAKGSVNAQMEEFAQTGAGQALTDAATEAELQKVARKAAFAAYRHGKKKPAAKAEVMAQLRAARAEQVTKAKAQADTWKGQLFAGTQVADAEDQVKTKVDQDQVGERSVKQAIKANTTAEGMAAIGRIADLAAPNRGDSAKIEVELRIPISGTPGFAKLHVAAEAERGVTTRKNGAPPGSVDAKSLKVGAQINIGGGVDAWGVRLDGTIGFFVRAQAMDTQKTFQALNYGAYRSACAINNGMADWWGGSGKSKGGPGGHGKGATERAELWAAMVEENVFMRKNPKYQMGSTDPKRMHEYIPDDDAFVDIGGALTAKGKLKAHVFEGEAQARGEMFKHYDGATIKKSINRAKTKGKISNTSNVGLGQGGDTLQEAQDRRKAIKGKTGGALILETKVAAAILGQKVEFAVKGEIGNTGWGVEIAAGLKLDTAADNGPSAFERIASGIVGSSASGLRSIIGMYQSTQQTGGEQVNKGIGTLLNMGDDAESIIDAATGGQLTTALGQAYQVNAAQSDQVNETVSNKFDDLTGQSNEMPENQATRAGASSEVMLQVLVQIGPGTVNLQIKEVKVRKLAVDLGPAALEAQVEKQKKLAQLGMVDGKFHAELLGFGNTRK